MDVYRHLSLFLSIKDFLSLTSCNKNLRRLYFEKGVIWKNFLERDFFYKCHPCYDPERYKLCFQRKNINFADHQDNVNDKLVYVDFDGNLSKLDKSLENWGLLYNNRPITTVFLTYTLLFCTSIFDENFESPLVSEFALGMIPNLIKDGENLIKYMNKSYDLLYKVVEVLSVFDPGIVKHPQTLPTAEFCKKHLDFNKANSMWQELGF